MRNRFTKAGMVVMAGLVGTGLLRAAAIDVAGHEREARTSLAGSSRAAGLEMQADKEPTPVVRLAALAGVQPGASAVLTAAGRYSAGLAVRVSRGPFTIADLVVTATSLKATVSAAQGALPALGEIEVVAPGGRARARAEALYVAGRWTFDVKAGNGWRMEAVSELATAEHANGSLPLSIKFFKDGQTTPFETRKGEISVQGASGTNVQIRVIENQPGSSPECDRVMARYQQLGKELGKGPNDKLMAEFEKLQDKLTACMEEQQKVMMEIVQKQQDPAYQAAEKAKKDDFGCEYVNLTSDAPGSVKGYSSCGRNVGQLAFAGTVTHSEK